MILFLLVGLTDTRAGQQQTSQDAGRPRQTSPLKTSPDTLQSKDPLTPTQSSDDAMRKAITRLSNQIGSLNEELARLRAETERNSAILELLLNEERLEKVEDKVQEFADRKVQLEAREQEFQRRLRNVQAEAALRGGLRREEAEAAVRAELQRALDDTRAQQTANQARLSELSERANRLRARVDSLRKKVEGPEEKVEKVEKDRD